MPSSLGRAGDRAKRGGAEVPPEGGDSTPPGDAEAAAYPPASPPAGGASRSRRATGGLRLAAAAHDLAHGLVAMEDGYGLHIVSRNAAPRPDRAREPILAHARPVTGRADL